MFRFWSFWRILAGSCRFRHTCYKQLRSFVNSCPNKNVVQQQQQQQQQQQHQHIHHKMDPNCKRSAQNLLKINENQSKASTNHDKWGLGALRRPLRQRSVPRTPKMLSPDTFVEPFNATWAILTWSLKGVPKSISSHGNQDKMRKNGDQERLRKTWNYDGILMRKDEALRIDN